MEIILPHLANLDTLILGVTEEEDFDDLERHIVWDVSYRDEIWSPPKCTQISPAMISKITRECPNLACLNISGHHVSDTEMSAILSAPGLSDRLVSLDVAYCDAPNTYRSDLWIRTFLHLIPNVRRFNANFVPLERRVEGRPPVVTTAPPLQSMLPHLETLYLRAYNYSSLKEDIQELTNLRDLTLPSTEMNDIVSSVASLTRLNAFFIKPGTEMECLQVLAMASRLKELNFFNGDSNPTPVLEAIPHLQKGSPTFHQQNHSLVN
jgi:hypothetical protein